MLGLLFNSVEDWIVEVSMAEDENVVKYGLVFVLNTSFMINVCICALCLSLPLSLSPSLSLSLLPSLSLCCSLTVIYVYCRTPILSLSRSPSSWCSLIIPLTLGWLCLSTRAHTHKHTHTDTHVWALFNSRKMQSALSLVTFATAHCLLEAQLATHLFELWEAWLHRGFRHGSLE